MLIFFSCSKDRGNRRKKAKYFNIKMILVKNTFKFCNHLFKSKTSIYVFGYNNIIIRNTFEKFQLNYYPKEILKILLLIPSSVCWGILWLSPQTLSFSHRCWKRSSLYLLTTSTGLLLFQSWGNTWIGSTYEMLLPAFTCSFFTPFLFILHLLFNFLRKLIFDSSLFSYCINLPPTFYLSLCDCSAWFRKRQWHPTPVLLPGKSHGWRSLVGCNPWGR